MRAVWGVSRAVEMKFCRAPRAAPYTPVWGYTPGERWGWLAAGVHKFVKGKSNDDVGGERE